MERSATATRRRPWSSCAMARFPACGFLRMSHPGWKRGGRRKNERPCAVNTKRVQSGEWAAQETRVPLYPYQREGMLLLSFTERASLADKMGLGNSYQAIAA